MIVETLTIAHRFRGPPHSGNGGYVCGRIARHIGGAAVVRLLSAPPLDRELQIDASQSGARLMSGATPVGEGRPAPLELAVPAPVSYEEATQASQSYAGFQHHTFPGCFVCGPQRQAADGLRIFAGSVTGRALIAAPWRVGESLGSAGTVPNEFLWAALDCPGAFAVSPPQGRMTLVLGQLHAQLNEAVHPAQRCVVMAWPIRTERRKRLAGTAVFAESGRLIAQAEAVWIEVPADAFT